ncbi:MAG: hypothetical protein ACKOWQ_06890 [Aquirufa sp.]
MDAIVFEKYYEKFKSNKAKMNRTKKGQLDPAFDFELEEDELEENFVVDRKLRSKEFFTKYRSILPKNDQTCLEFLFECCPLKRNLMSMMNEVNIKKYLLQILPKLMLY